MHSDRLVRFWAPHRWVEGELKSLSKLKRSSVSRIGPKLQIFTSSLWALPSSKLNTVVRHSGRVLKSRGAAGFQVLRRNLVRLSRKSQRFAQSRCKCWSRCPPGCSRGPSHLRWSPPSPDTAAAGWGRSLRRPRLRAGHRQTSRQKQTLETGNNSVSNIVM